MSEHPTATFSGPRSIAHYRVLRELGAGAMGTVLLAHDERMDRDVALKVFTAGGKGFSRADVRFENEAWIAGKLSHTNIVRIFDRGSSEGYSYFSMELVDGGTLQDVIQNMKRWGRDERWGLELDTAQYVQWCIRQIVIAARALDFAHGRGVVHRDVKPGNLLLSTERGEVMVADFGLAIDRDLTRLTTDGKLLGTLAFMAPEQIRGDRQIDARADVYALSVTLFQLLTLKLPYPGETEPRYMNEILNSPPLRPRPLNGRVSHDLETVILKGLEKDPRDRYPSAASFAEDLKNVLDLRPIRAHPPGRLTRAWKWARRKPVHAALVALLIAGVPVLTTLGYLAVNRYAERRAMLADDLWRHVRTLHQQGRHTELIATATRLLDLTPDHSRARRARALAHLEQALKDDDHDEAKAALDDASELIRRNPGASWTHTLRGYLLERLGRSEEAAEELEIADTTQKGALAPDELQYGAWMAMDRGQPEEAVELLTRLVTLQPTNGFAYADRADAYEMLGSSDRAAIDYRIAIGIMPQEATFQVNLGRLLTESGQLDEGRRVLEEAIQLAPDNAVAHQNLGDNLLRQARDVQGLEPPQRLKLAQRAEKAARRSLVLDGEDPFTRLNLAASLVEEFRFGGRSEKPLLVEAVQQADQVLEENAGAPAGKATEAYIMALDNSCDALIELKDLERALARCREATEASPKKSIGYYNLAGVYMMLGRAEEALIALERDVEFGDTDSGYLQQDSWFEPLHSDPRFHELIDSMQRNSDAGGG